MNNKLCKLMRQAVAHMYENPENIDQIVKNATEAGHRILTIHLGEPPVSFDWEWTDNSALALHSILC